MQALLIFKERGDLVRVMVNVKQKNTENRVASLMGDNKSREAFRILKTQGEVESYFPEGSKVPEVPLVLSMVGAV